MMQRLAQFGDRELLRLAFESAPCGMLLCDDAGTIVLANQAVERIFGYSQEELVGSSVEMLVPTEQRAAHARARVTVSEASVMRHPAGREVVGIARDGRRVPLEVGLTPIRHDGVKLSVASVVDLTGRKRLEDQVRHAQKMEAVGTLAGGIAHDFTNLLLVMMSYAHFVRDELCDGDRRRGDLDEILKAADKAASLARQLLAFSRRAPVSPRVIDLDAVLADAGKMLRRTLPEDIELVVLPSAESIRVEIDPVGLDQVLMNLAVNARDAMPEGGKLTFWTRAASDTAATLIVSDTGCGMDEATRERAFEPFFTTKEQGAGTGLGLASCYGIIAQAGGTIELDSAPGAGTRFEITLPRASGPVTEVVETRSLDTLHGFETILVTEDEPAVLRMTARLLRSVGYRVLEAHSGHEALRVHERASAEIDLLLTDVVMPHLSGRELAETLWREDPGLPVVFVSGYTDDVRLQHNGHRPFPVVTKPFRAAQLLRAIRESLDGGRALHSSSSAAG